MEFTNSVGCVTFETIPWFSSYQVLSARCLRDHMVLFVVGELLEPLSDQLSGSTHLEVIQEHQIDQ